MAEKPDTAVLRGQVKLALSREAYRRGWLTEAQLALLIQRQQTPRSPEQNRR